MVVHLEGLRWAGRQEDRQWADPHLAMAARRGDRRLEGQAGGPLPLPPPATDTLKEFVAAAPRLSGCALLIVNPVAAQCCHLFHDGITLTVGT